jgi:hypothetical protein
MFPAVPTPSAPSARPAPLRFLAACAAFLLACVAPVHATSVVPPSFAELVADADAIYRGTVTAVTSRHVARPDGQGAVIKTFVTVRIEKVLKGAERPEVTLEFLGGTVGDESLVVQGMPKFAVGDREFVFVQRNGIQFCPLVAMSHGRYRQLRDAATGRDYVARDNRMPLTDTAEVALPMTALPGPVRAAAAATALTDAFTPADFEAKVSAELARPAALKPRIE